jgi:hypothetical protein
VTCLDVNPFMFFVGGLCLDYLLVCELGISYWTGVKKSVSIVVFFSDCNL